MSDSRNIILKVVRNHFTRASSQGGLFLEGEYYRAAHNDSLSMLVKDLDDEFTALLNHQDSKIVDLENEVKSLKKQISEKEGE